MRKDPRFLNNRNYTNNNYSFLNLGLSEMQSDSIIQYVYEAIWYNHGCMIKIKILVYLSFSTHPDIPSSWDVLAEMDPMCQCLDSWYSGWYCERNGMYHVSICRSNHTAQCTQTYKFHNVPALATKKRYGWRTGISQEYSLKWKRLFI